MTSKKKDETAQEKSAPEPSIWDELRKPFPREVVGVLPKPYKRDSPKSKCGECGGYHGLPAVHLDYVGHAAVTDRLNSVLGPDNWYWEPLSLDERGLPALDKSGNLWIRLLVREDAESPWSQRLGYGDGSDSIKELIGDALRNAGKRFGIALDLWSKEELESTLVHPASKNARPTREADGKDGGPRPATQIQKSRITAYLRGRGIADDNIATTLTMAHGVKNPSGMTFEEADRVLVELENGQAAQA